MQPLSLQSDFNPLPRKEGDAELKALLDAESAISIHSLVKRETSAGVLVINRTCDFNPLPRKEGDPLHLFP